MEPPLADKRPEMVFRSVVLPCPLGPTTAMNSPAPTSSDRPTSTFSPLYPADRFLIASSGVAITVAPLRQTAPSGAPMRRRRDRRPPLEPRSPAPPEALHISSRRGA